MKPPGLDRLSLIDLINSSLHFWACASCFKYCFYDMCVIVLFCIVESIWV